MKSQAMDGRQSFAWILDDKSKTKLTGPSGKLEYGDIAVVTKQGASSIFGNASLVNKFILVTKTGGYTLADGDECVKFKSMFIGMAKDKSLNKSKNTSDVTVDADIASSSVTDGIVTLSGSISMSFSVDGSGYASNFIKSRFGSVVHISEEGTISVEESDTTAKDLVMFAWNARNAGPEDTIEFEIVPCIFTGLNHSASYGSSQSLDLDFTGNATDENGYEYTSIQVDKGLNFIKSLSTNRAGMDEDAKSA